MLGPGGKLIEPRSESGELHYALDVLSSLVREPNLSKSHRLMVQSVIGRLTRLRGQVAAGYHRNPMLITYNPPHAPIITDDVQAILYRHAEDGKDYVHAFGGVEPAIKHRGSSVTLDGLAETTGVQALVRDGGRAITLRHTDGAMLAKEF